jgi:hypothetical protein
MSLVIATIPMQMIMIAMLFLSQLTFISDLPDLAKMVMTIGGFVIAIIVGILIFRLSLKYMSSFVEGLK